MSEESALVKIQTVKRIFSQIDPSVRLKVNDLGEGQYSIEGPHPSFMLLINEDEKTVRSVIHVNADATNMVFIFNQFNKELEIEQDGAFAVTEDSILVFDFDAYQEKERLMVEYAKEIKQRRPDIDKKKNEIYVPDQKEIYLGN